MKKTRFIFLFVVLIAFLFFPARAGANPPADTSSASLSVESIEISGNSKTRRQVILSLLDFRVGDSINRQQLDRNFRRLEETNFFKKVNLYTQPGSSRGQIRVFIEIKERYWPYFQFKSGYSELDGWYVSPLGIRFDNLLGRGNYMGAELFIGDRVSGLDISYLRPNFLDSNLNVRVLMFTRNRQFVHYVDGDKYLQDVAQGGISLRVNGNSGLMKYLWFEFVSGKFDAQEFMTPAGKSGEEVTLPEVLQPFSGEKKVGRFISSLYIDTRDQRYYPTGGWWGSLSLDQVNKEFGAFANYNKIILDVRRYQALPGGAVLAVRLKGGWVDNNAPFYEKFYLGGPNSLRGYKDRSLNPLGYASRVVQGSGELRFPITRRNFPRHFLTGVVFFDFGQAWNEPDRLDGKKFSTSVGYGFRFRLPIVGLLRLDFAYPIPDYKFKLHLSLGHTF